MTADAKPGTSKTDIWGPEVRLILYTVWLSLLWFKFRVLNSPYQNVIDMFLRHFPHIQNFCCIFRIYLENHLEAYFRNCQSNLAIISHLLVCWLVAAQTKSKKFLNLKVPSQIFFQKSARETYFFGFRSTNIFYTNYCNMIWHSYLFCC